MYSSRQCLLLAGAAIVACTETQQAKRSRLSDRTEALENSSSPVDVSELTTKWYHGAKVEEITVGTTGSVTPYPATISSFVGNAPSAFDPKARNGLLMSAATPPDVGLASRTPMEMNLRLLLLSPVLPYAHRAQHSEEAMISTAMRVRAHRSQKRFGQCSATLHSPMLREVHSGITAADAKMQQRQPQRKSLCGALT